MTEADTQARSVYIWVAEGTWRATVDAALDLAPAGSRFTLLHVTPGEVPDAARGAYAGLLGRAGRDPATRLEQMAATSAGELLAAAAGRLGRPCERLDVQGRAERAVVAASAQADLLIVARDGDRSRSAQEPGQDHPVRRRSRSVSGSAGLARVRARRRHHSPAATSPFPAGPLNLRNPDTSCWACSGRRRASAAAR